MCNRHNRHSKLLIGRNASNISYGSIITFVTLEARGIKEKAYDSEEQIKVIDENKSWIFSVCQLISECDSNSMNSIIFNE